MAKKTTQKSNYNDDEREFLGLSPETKQGIWIVVLLTAGVLSILSFLGWAGLVGMYFDKILRIVFGWLKFLFPIITIALGYMLLKKNKYFISRMNYFGMVVLVLAMTGLTHLYYPIELSIFQAQSGYGGGFLGVAFSYPLLKFTSFWAALIILVALLFISILITFNTTFENLAEHSKFIALPIHLILYPFKMIFGLIKRTQKHENNETQKHENNETQKHENNETQKHENNEINDYSEYSDDESEEYSQKVFKKKNKKNLVQSQITFPKHPKIDLPLSLLNNKADKPSAGDVEATREKIARTFENFGIDVEMCEYNVGPTVAQYTCRPADGVKLNRITSLSNDLSLALAAHPIRIEAPIPGRSLVGIEVPNRAVAVVNLREILESKEFKNRKSNLAMSLGKDVKGNAWIANLDNMPHLLIAGSTGSGKSVCINTIIISLLYQNGPDDLKFIMVDPKRVELINYNGIPHLVTPVITDAKKTVNALKWCLNEMDRRFDLLSKCGHRNIASHNNSTEEKLPYIVFIIDELADLMAVAASDVEAAIIRLAQMARAVGIHLILATQRPSVDVITGLIKANITSRIAFSVASLMDSRTILDTSGAEKLVGRGDMLYISSELSKPKRLQGAYVSDDEIRRVVEYLKEQGEETDYTDQITEKQTLASDPISSFEPAEDDELFEEAKEIVIRAKKASASLLQRRLKIGYARAARILDLMEEADIIGPAQGAKPREILAGEEALSVEQSYGDGIGVPHGYFKHGDEMADESEIPMDEDEEEGKEDEGRE